MSSPYVQSRNNNPSAAAAASSSSRTVFFGGGGGGNNNGANSGSIFGLSRLRSSAAKKPPEPLRRAVADCLLSSSAHYGSPSTSYASSSSTGSAFEASRTLRDHLALMMELLGMMPRKIALGGRYSRDFFNRSGDLRHIRRLRFWHLNKVLKEKYDFSELDANDMADFLIPMLDFVPDKRPTAAQCLAHQWISAGPRQLQPSAASFDDSATEEKRKEMVEREAMELGLDKIDIDGAATGLGREPRGHRIPSKDS